MNSSYRYEMTRLSTFVDWPIDFIDRHVLAQTGMFYTHSSDKVKCYFCEVEIGQWEESDDPVREHIKWSANCPLLRRRTTNNIPINIDALELILPPVSYDVCGSSNDIIEVRPTAYPEDSISTYHLKYPEYAVEAARCRSFAEWPRIMKQKPEELAAAGFFYTGTGDRVNCFSCGGGLKDWDETDEPWEQHAHWMSKCRYLKLMKGQPFIDAVLAKYNLTSNKSEDVCGTQILTAATTTTTPIPSEEKLCKICYDAEYNTAFLPCGHIVSCAKCSTSVTKCPLCRKPFVDVMVVYFS